jgi:ferredoxin
MPLKINADRDRCITAGQCVLTEPAVFDQGDDGIVRLLVAEVGPDLEQPVRTAVSLCPSGAITIDGETGE